MGGALAVTGDADQFLNGSNPLARLISMLLDQHMR
jgi:hypothetical protein